MFSNSGISFCHINKYTLNQHKYEEQNNGKSADQKIGLSKTVISISISWLISVFGFLALLF